MAYPQGSENFIIICDASNTAIGAVLLQTQAGEDIPLEFASKSLSLAERNWDAYEREIYAIRWAVQKFEEYIKINGSNVYTDQQSYEKLMVADSGKIKQIVLVSATVHTHN